MKDDNRYNEGYKIISESWLDEGFSYVIGYHPDVASPYVVWDYYQAHDSYSCGIYCQSFTQAVSVITEKWEEYYDYLFENDVTDQINNANELYGDESSPHLKRKGWCL